MTHRRILVTAALPYANGHIHIGHLTEYVQTDVWVRFQKLRGNQCIFICADDTHGTPIMMRARQEGRSEEALIAEMSEHHRRDFAEFHIDFDNYGSTNSEENRHLCGEIWKSLREADLVVEREIEQLFDPEAGVFLADRFVMGTCPNESCQAPDQYGDNCDVCGSTYQPMDLKDPVSTLSGAKPEVRPTKQLFVRIEQFHEFLEEWISTDNHVQPEIANFLKGQFLKDPLRDWDISRPTPYFGFEIPDSPGNYWYVWFDAPIGYIASTKQWCDGNDQQLDDWWKSESTEIHHFIGKDITYFHTLFWPAMLKSAGFQLPTAVHIHGFLTVNNRKMAKRDGTFVLARTYLNHLDPSALRYYLVSKLGSRLDNIDLNLEELVNKINADLIGKVVNLASRTAKFVQSVGLSAEYPEDGGLFHRAAALGDEIAEAYENLEYNKAMRLILSIADQANPYVEDAQPWVLRKDESKAQQLQDVCTVALNLFRQLVIYLSPVLPELREKTERLLNVTLDSWEASKTPQVGTPVAKFQHLMKRIEEKDVQAMIEESREANAADAAPKSQDSDEPLKAEPLAEQCTIDDFIKVDLRVARVVAAELIPEARKLLRLTLSLGGDETRTVFAGIKAAYQPESLVGRLVVCVANLAPRKMKFGVSEGMVVASGTGGEEVFLLSPDDGAKPGERVH
ncbi:MAG TPA: methionine--tRNA ligase [Planctomycetes bacterium]|nr:methionine--tRNA ligase [Planctomycetota bacterium]